MFIYINAMAHFLSPQEARNLWEAYKKSKLSYGHQERWARSWAAQGRKASKNYWNIYGQIGRAERDAYGNLQRKLITKYHIPEYRGTWSWREEVPFINSLKPIYGFGGAINRVRRVRARARTERAAAESVRGGLEKWRIRAGTRLAEKMLNKRIIEKMRNIERKIALVRRANTENARRNARRAINNSGLNANVKARYYNNLNTSSGSRTPYT
jgi:hypothetical protein